MNTLITRRRLLAGSALAAPALLIGCDYLSTAPTFRGTVLQTGEWINYRVHRLIGSDSLAREYAEADLSPVFRTNGNTTADNDDYRRHMAEGFANWELVVDGLVDRPGRYSLAQLKALPSRTQITLHNCVEGWSAVGKWTGAPLAPLLTEAKLKPEARFIVFHCADAFGDRPYYESIDLIDAFHPQTILAYGMNDTDLPEGHGAPLRLRVERQLGYKHAKYVMRVEAVSDLRGLYAGKGGYWEDAGAYAWYAGI